jgi:hypothetical protein
VVLYVFCGTLVFATLGLARPSRFQWTLRAVAGVIALAYAAYATSEAVAWWHGKPFGPTASKASSNLRNALWGFVVFGVPSLFFLFKGRSGTSMDAFLGLDADPETPLEDDRAAEEAEEPDEPLE